jgi:tetratricopeptide (TPR) repeat protein
MNQRFLLVILILATLPAAAAFTFNENCRQAYEDLMCLRLSEARSRMANEKSANPVNQVPWFIENYADFLTVLIGEEEKDFLRLQNNRDLRLQKLAASGSDSPWFLYSQAVVYLQSGFARVKFGEYVNASLDVSRAYRLLNENERKFPGFVMNKAGLGILHSLIGTVPEKYRWATRSLSFEGSIPEGQAELKDAFQTVTSSPDLHFLIPETAFLLAFTTLNLTASVPSALELAAKFEVAPLAELAKESPLLIYAEATICTRAGLNDRAIRLLSAAPKTADRYPFHYLDYMLGIAKLNRLDPDACYPLLGFLGSFKGKNYIKSAYMHLAWYYLLRNDPKQYAVYIQRISLRGNNQVDNDREAVAFAESGRQPAPALLRARLLSDGGYYEKAIRELDGFKAGTTRDELEYAYRLGRIYHNQGKTDKAQGYYTETIRKGSTLPYYFAANAALQLGLISEQKKDYTLARKYYSEVLDMEFDEYRFSICNKAEAGLNRIKGK